MLDEADVQGVIRLLGGACALSGGHAEKKRNLMDGLCALVGADAWVWVLASRMDPGTLPVLVGYQHGGFRDDQFAKFLEIQSHPDTAELIGPFAEELQLGDAHVTRTMAEIVPVERFMSCAVARCWEECGLLPHCVSARPLGGGPVAGVGLYCQCHKPLLGAREARIVHLVLSEIPWLLEHGWPEDRAVKINELSPRLRIVHEMLLQGFSRKQIAGNLGLSIHTVHGYVKELYRQVGVQSHTALLRRFFNCSQLTAR